MITTAAEIPINRQDGHNPIADRRQTDEKRKRKLLNKACQLPRDRPSDLDMPRLNVVQGSVPKEVLSKKDKQKPKIITDNKSQNNSFLDTFLNFMIRSSFILVNFIIADKFCL